MEGLLRERLEEVLLNFAETLEPDRVPEDLFEEALQEALDAMESILMSDRISPDWLISEFEVARDTTPDMSTEDLLRKLADSVNEKLKDRDIDII